MESIGVRHGHRNDGCNLGVGVVYFQRLIFCAVVALMSWLPASSYASFAATSGAVARSGGICWGGGDIVGYQAAATDIGACMASVAAAVHTANGSLTVSTAWYVYAPADSGDTETYRQIYTGGWKENAHIAVACPSGSTWDAASASCLGVTCPIHSTLAGSLCTCSSGYAESGSSCVLASEVPNTHCAGLGGSSAGSMVAPYVSGAALNSTYVYLCEAIPGSFGSQPTSGCLMSVSYDMAAYGEKTGSSRYTGAGCEPGSGDGTNATGAPTSASSLGTGALPNTCPVGTFPGTVNGLSVCASAVGGTVTLPGGTATATAPGGSTSSPTSGLGPDAPAGAVSSVTNNTYSNGGVTTTTSYYNSTGGSVGTTTTTSTVSSYCSNNAGSGFCGGLGQGGGTGGTGTGAPSSFADACGQAPSCSGDAIQCAIARATFQSDCALNPAASTESALYDTSKVLTGDQTGALPGNATVALTSGSFSTTELLGTASGLSDLSVSVMGRTVSLPFSNLNSWLAALGYLGQAVTFLLCLRIVSRG